MFIAVIVVVIAIVVLTAEASAQSGGAGNLIGAIMGRLNAQQIAQVAAQAGFQGDDLVTAVAIALAESGGDPNASGDSGTSIGLWQIHYTVHPEFDPAQLSDPQYNANSAYSIFIARGSFADWSTFTGWTKNGHVTPPYLAYMTAAQNGTVNV